MRTQMAQNLGDQTRIAIYNIYDSWEKLLIYDLSEFFIFKYYVFM